NFGDGGTHGLAVASGGTAVDHHDTVRGHDEAGIDDVAAVERVEVVRRAFQQPDIFGDLAWLQPVLQLGLCRKRQAQREGQDEQAHVASLAEWTAARYNAASNSLPLLSRSHRRVSSWPFTSRLSVGFSLTAG